VPANQVAFQTEVTVKNLQIAFEGESNAHAKYVEFAAKADADGLPGVASLFRAAARAEQIHAHNHARALHLMGSEAKARVHPIEVKSTLENLKSALAGEQHEVDVMYPEFLAEADARNNTAASRTLDWALEAEKTHARLYSEAITLLESNEADSWLYAVRNFYVCVVCGYTS